MGALFAGMVLLHLQNAGSCTGATPTKDLYPSPVSKPRVAESKAGLKSPSACTTEFVMDNGVGSTMTVGRVKPIARKFDRPRQDLNASGFLTSVIGAAWGRKDQEPTGLASAHRDTRAGSPHPDLEPRFG